MKTAILTTTINTPHCLKDYCENFKKFGHSTDSVGFVVVEDKKTPKECTELCESLQAEYGYEFQVFSVDRQQTYLKDFPEIEKMHPWNSIQRRNIGLLYIIQNNYDAMISIDDDNLVGDEDFLGAHIKSLGQSADYPHVVESSTGWYNVVDLMEANQPRVYHRGFPLNQWWKDEQISEKSASKQVVVNAGLWTGDPDIDALTRLYYPVKTTQPADLKEVVLEKGTWCSFNTQNTAFHRECLPAAFLIVMMNYNFSTVTCGRYDDIWMSYFLRRIADHMGHSVRYGFPVVNQERNIHVIYKDLAEELPCMEINAELIRVVQECQFSSQSYLDCYMELAHHLADGFKGHKQEVFVREITEQMLVWAKSIQKVLS